MNMQSEQGNLNGYPTLYLMVGELRQGQKHLETGLHVLNEKVDKLERNARRKIIPVPKGWMSSLTLKDMSGLIFGATILFLAIAGKWGLIGDVARSFGR
jgi:hypothetical protein